VIVVHTCVDVTHKSQQIWRFPYPYGLCNPAQIYRRKINDIWYDMMWCDMIWYDMMWYDMIWYDMIWYDMIWYDMIWYDMIWYDVTSWSMWVPCGTEYLHLMPLRNCEFRESFLVKSHTLLMGVNKMLPLFLHFSSELDKIQGRRYSHSAVKQLLISWNSDQWTIYFTCVN